MSDQHASRRQFMVYAAKAAVAAAVAPVMIGSCLKEDAGGT